MKKGEFALKRVVIVLLALFLIAPDLALAQRRSRTRRRTTPRAATPPQPAANAAAEKERAEAATRVADQIKRMSLFLYLYGGTVKTIEDAEKALAKSTPSESDREAIERSKAAVRTNIQNVRLGLERIENDFGNQPSLRPYYSVLLGASDLAARAEQQAQANQYNVAGRTLVTALEKLVDTLGAMRVE